jgi:ParB family chromosome partitioning protein
MELELHQVERRYAGLRRRDARRERALVASLAEAGQQTPVVVVCGEGGRHVLVDGYKRVRALERLGRDTVIATTWDLSEAEALLLTQVMRASAGDSALEQAWVLRELHERHGLAAPELARRFDKTTSWVSRRLALVRELPEAVQELVRRGELSAHAAMKHLVPLARANLEGCLELAPVLAGHGLTTRQVGALCAAWAAGTPESRRLILAEPQLVLRAEAEAKRPKELSPGERLLADVATVAAIARRARRVVVEEKRKSEATRTRWGPELVPALRAAEADTSALFAALHQENNHAG